MPVDGNTAHNILQSSASPNTINFSTFFFFYEFQRTKALGKENDQVKSRNGFEYQVKSSMTSEE